MDWEKAMGPTLGHCAHLARERLDARLSRYDVTPAQTQVLLYLARQGGQAPQCVLTQSMRVKPSTVNGILDRLEEKGMVERSVSGRDARRRLITITKKGLELQALFMEAFQATERTILRGFAPEEAAALHSYLERVIRNLEEDRTL